MRKAHTNKFTLFNYSGLIYNKILWVAQVFKNKNLTPKKNLPSNLQKNGVDKYKMW